jgi:hypothetical protein
VSHYTASSKQALRSLLNRTRAVKGARAGQALKKIRPYPIAEVSWFIPRPEKISLLEESKGLQAPHNAGWLVNLVVRQALS